MRKKLKMPTNDEECRVLLKGVCGRTDEQIDGIFEYSELVKDLRKNLEGKENDVL